MCYNQTKFIKNHATLFIDESGKSSLAEEKHQPFLLTGVILENNDIQTVEGFFNYIKRKFEIAPDKSFHSYELYEDPKIKLSQEKVALLSDTLSEFISLIPVKIYLAVVNKENFKNALGIKSNNDFKGSVERKEMKSFPYRIMATYLFARFGEYLSNKQAVGQIIADSRRGADHQLLKTLNLCKEGAVPIKEEFLKTIKNNLTALCFAEKGFLSGGLEIADLVSYVSFMHYRRQLSNFSNQNMPKIWEQIKQKSTETVVSESVVRKFFRIKKGEVHKYLKST